MWFFLFYSWNYKASKVVILKPESFILYCGQPSGDIALQK